MDINDQGIERSFLDWSSEEVVKWLSTLSLRQDYSTQFREHNINGATLIKLNPGALDQLGITTENAADRVKILQQITTMRADLIPSRTISPTRRVHSPTKLRRFSETVRPMYLQNHRTPSNTGMRRHRKSTSSSTVDRTFSPIVPVHTPVREASPKVNSLSEAIAAQSPIHSSPSRLSTDQMSSDSPDSSRMNSPVKLRDASASPHYALETREFDYFNKLQTTATLRGHNMRRLSRSLDRLFQDGEDIFSLGSTMQHQDTSNTRLVEILKEENVSLKRELECYYQRVRKLQKLEQEVERIREAHRLLESSASRQVKLEQTLRVKVEEELKRTKEKSNYQMVKLQTVRKHSTSSGESPKGKSREIKKRDTMILRLIKQNQDAAVVREQLQKDLHSAKAQLRDRGTGTAADATEGGNQEATELDQENSTEDNMAQIYSESIDKLKGVLSAMQNTSQKREKLEKRLRTQLQKEINRLKGTSSKGEKIKESKSDLQRKIATLESDVAKWEHKCLELVAERQMALDAAVIPRDTKIGRLERNLAENIDLLQEYRQQRIHQAAHIADTNRKITELEIQLVTAQTSLHEKEALIHTLQQSFLEPEDHHGTPNDRHHSPPSPPSSHNPHYSPVPQTKLGFSQTTGLPSHSMSLPPSESPPGPPPSPPKYWNTPNGGPGGSRNHHKSAVTSPVKGYNMDRSLSASPVKTISERMGLSQSSPIKRHSDRGTPSKLKIDSHSGQVNGNNNVMDYSPPMGSYGQHYRKLSPQSSSSAPNSPGVHKPRKPRISQPNLKFLAVPPPMLTQSNEHSFLPNGGSHGTSSNNSRLVKSNTGGLIRNHSPVMVPGLYGRAVKSKTPPPNYKLVAIPTADRKNSVSGGVMTKQTPKLRHHSVDDILEITNPSLGSSCEGQSMQNGHLELFNSLLGDSMPSLPSQIHSHSRPTY